MAQARNLVMDEVFTHPLGPLPWALSTPDGLLRKTNKAALAAGLLKNVQFNDSVPKENIGTVIDGMSLVQIINEDRSLFGQVANNILGMALREGAMSNRIDVVFDSYNELSIKSSERLLRGEVAGHQLCGSITSQQIVRQWGNFLAYENIKTSLISFLVHEWKSEANTRRLEGKVLYSNFGEKCYKIADGVFEEVPLLKCEQEEADGRLLLHAFHAAQEGYPFVLICLDDTDVLIMALAVTKHVNSRLLIKMGTRNRTKVVDVNKVAASAGHGVCQALIGLHAFTGCDTASSNEDDWSDEDEDDEFSGDEDD
ncbi:predicted protein [Nematostella vectensis]|uniref:Uncharacterized protein n=1 Tax=Nematostella vectensis TaxID=45351 RepID=A7S2B9_NEMVE|nr:predicted protein [Nematostella vectensis]|eukprot:XP_001634178.1 predicted protein [Nematostella vectensis]